MRLSNVKETDFITVILTRTMETEEGYKFNTNNIESTNDLFIRYRLAYSMFAFQDFFAGMLLVQRLGMNQYQLLSSEEDFILMDHRKATMFVILKKIFQSMDQNK